MTEINQVNSLNSGASTSAADRLVNTLSDGQNETNTGRIEDIRSRALAARAVTTRNSRRRQSAYTIDRGPQRESTRQTGGTTSRNSQRRQSAYSIDRGPERENTRQTGGTTSRNSRRRQSAYSIDRGPERENTRQTGGTTSRNSQRRQSAYSIDRGPERENTRQTGGTTSRNSRRRQSAYSNDRTTRSTEPVDRSQPNFTNRASDRRQSFRTR